MFCKLLCFFGLHDWEDHPNAITTDEAAKLVLEATADWQVFTSIFTAAYLVGLKKCARCGKDSR